MSSISALIVSWNVRDYLERCLQSLLPQMEPGDEVIVVDNGSDDGTSGMLRQFYPAVTLVETGANLGFSGAINCGLRRAKGDLILVLNPDTELYPFAVRYLCRMLECDSTAGLVAPTLLSANGERQQSRRRFPHLATLFFESTPLQKLGPVKHWLRHFYFQDKADNHAQAVEWVWGACFLLRRQALVEIGAMDESFFMYSEEIDLCHRLVDLGWSVIYEPAARVVHHEGKSSDQLPVARFIRFNRSKVIYAGKHFNHLVAGMLRFFLLGTFVWEMTVERAKLLLGHKPELRRQRVGAYSTVLKSGLRGT